MKKFFGIVLVILIIMFIIVGYNSNKVESFKLPNGTQSNSSVITAGNVNLEDIHKPKQDNSKVISPEKDTEKLQEQDQKNKDVIIKEQDKKKSDVIAKQKKDGGIDPNKPMVALTFDDGPHPKYTMQILDALKKYKGSATFFILGNRAEEYKSVVKSIVVNGNQIGNHTYDHKQLTKLSDKAIINEIDKTNNILQNISNIKPSEIRPTYGSINDNVKLYAGKPLILWSIDTLDWKTRNKKMIVNEVLGKVKDGDIVLMHDIYKTTADAAEVIIKELSSRGYQMVTIDELYDARGIDLVEGQVYSNAYKKK